MRLSISNIAWEVKDDEVMASFLRDQGVTAIDIAPSKYFSPDMTPSDMILQQVKDFWSSYGIDIVGLQSLLFGTSGLNIFDLSTQGHLLKHLEKVARIGHGLGAKYLVFGSPKNRDISRVESAQVDIIAKDFFSRLGEIGRKYDVVFCLEPNPKIYGCNFLTHSYEVAAFVKDLKHPYIKMQLDTGTIVTNDEDFRNEIVEYKQYIGHIHLSTTGLAPISSARERLVPIVEVIKNEFPNRIATIEMVASPEVFDSVVFAKELLNG